MNDIELIPTPALGDNSYLLVSGDEAAVVDPQRDAWPLVEATVDRALSLRYVLETHVHNDYVSGAREWQAATGATVVGPGRAAYAFPHLPVVDGDEIVFGDLAHPCSGDARPHPGASSTAARRPTRSPTVPRPST